MIYPFYYFQVHFKLSNYKELILKSQIVRSKKRKWNKTWDQNPTHT